MSHYSAVAANHGSSEPVLAAAGNQSAIKSNTGPPMSVQSMMGSTCKPISENPKFGEMQQEELRNRLLFVKQAVSKNESDSELVAISNAFTSKQIKIFLNLVNIVSSLEQEKIEEILRQKLKEGVSAELCPIVDKHAEFFIAEFSHFCRLHGFVKV